MPFNDIFRGIWDQTDIHTSTNWHTLLIYDIDVDITNANVSRIKEKPCRSLVPEALLSNITINYSFIRVMELRYSKRR